LPKSVEAQVMGKQLLRCGTSVAANYRAVCRARSKAEFIARIGVVAAEADESVLWLELLQETHVLRPEQLAEILKRSEGACRNIFCFTEDSESQSLDVKLPNYQMTQLPNSNEHLFVFHFAGCVAAALGAV
jgi:four helix bundle protein